MYAVGATEEDKEEADREFYDNMVRIIMYETAGWYEDPKRQELVREECLRQAKTYYTLVHLFGGPAFWAGKREDVDIDVV